MCTSSGRQFWPCDPRPEEVDIHDIAHHLAIENRFCGALPEPYSVAQHSYYASLICERFLGGSIEEQLWALLHDSAEAYCKDIHRPLKMALPGYKEIEKGVTRAIMAKFGLPFAMPAKVRQADEICLTLERRDLFSASHKQLWVLGGTESYIPSRSQLTFYFMHWREARRYFIERFTSLFNR